MEDNLLDLTIDKETFKRKHDEINYEIQNLENDSATIENNRGFDLDLVNDVLNLDNNLYETYQNAVFEAKRHYLSIFFERIEVYDKKIQNVVYAPLFQKLLEAEKVTVSSNWLPLLDSLRNHFGDPLLSYSQEEVDHFTKQFAHLLVKTDQGPSFV